MNYLNKSNNSNIGIVSFGTKIPKYRITTEEISKVWGKKEDVGKSLGIIEKTVPAIDEDTITLATNSGRIALDRINNKRIRIGAIFTGSESHPYAVKPTSVIVGQALLDHHDYTAADLEFACKAGTAAIQIIINMIAAGTIDYGFAIGADTAQSKPGDPLEYSAAAAGASYIFGKKPGEIIAKLIASTSYTSDTPDFWRREHQHYPSHGGRFTGEPAYFKHIQEAIKKILTLSGLKISDFDHVVFHMPNGRFPQSVAKTLGVSGKQMRSGFVVPILGNSYSACSLVGLARVLEHAKPREKILLCSYGSGSGSDAFVFETTKNLSGYNKDNGVDAQIKNKEYVSYIRYIRNLNKLVLT